MDSCPPVVAFVRSSHMWGRSGSSTLVARGSTPWPQHLAPLGLGECWHSRPQGDGCCSPLPAHLVVIAVPLQVAATATSVVVIFRTPSIASSLLLLSCSKIRRARLWIYRGRCGSAFGRNIPIGSWLES
jgi:hypothetical protein